MCSFFLSFFLAFLDLIMSFDQSHYDDLIVRHRQSSDIVWAMKNWHHPLFDDKQQSRASIPLVKRTQSSSVITPVHYTCLPRNSEQIKLDVLNSLPLKYAIEQLNDPNGIEKAKAILTEMSHRLSMRSVRVLGYIFAKLFNQVFEHIYVDRMGIERIRQLYYSPPAIASTTAVSSPMTISSTLFAILNTFSRSSSSPANVNAITPSSPLTSTHYFTPPRIVYLPTHRSYMDFILMTYLCFEANLPLPCIAAAQDFLGLGRIFANLLRNCGAFFIRRSFRSDALYWTIFDEFVKAHIIHGDYPLEFFVEGARSRTLKTLLPARQGMLKSCLECYFHRHVDNLTLIPVTINYEKVLEDNLHAYELLGVPKPKESTSGLFKALQIVNKRFGTMIVKFSEPIQVHDAYEQFRQEEKQTDVDRCIPRGIQPRFICQQDGFTSFENHFVDDLTYRIVHEQQRSIVIYPITLAAFSFLTCSIVSTKSRSVSIEQLHADKLHLFPGNIGVLERFSSHHELCWSSGDGNLQQRLLFLYSDMFELLSGNNLILKMTGDRLADAALLMKLIMYRNTCLHLFAKPAYILLVCQAFSQTSISYEHLKAYYYFFVHLFAYEFVYDRFPTDDNNDHFDTYLSYWRQTNYLHSVDNSSYSINPNFQQQIALITSPFEQYARAYLTIYEIENLSTSSNMSTLIKVYQKYLLTKLDTSNIVSVLASSSNVIANALRTSDMINKSKSRVDLRQMLMRIFSSIPTRLRAKL